MLKGMNRVFETGSMLALVLMTMSAAPLSAAAQDEVAPEPAASGHEAWVRLDRSGQWAWGVETTTAVWHGADHFVWTVAVAPEPTSVEGELVNYVVMLNRFRCQDTDESEAMGTLPLEIEPLAAYALGPSGPKRPLSNLRAVQIPINQTVAEGVCSLGLGSPPAQPTASDLPSFVASVMRADTYWDELWFGANRQ